MPEATLRSIPMMVLFKGGRLVKTIVGARPKPDILKVLADSISYVDTKKTELRRPAPHAKASTVTGSRTRRR